MSNPIQPSTKTSSAIVSYVERAKQLVQHGDLQAALVHLSSNPNPIEVAKAHADLAAFLYTVKDVSGMLTCGRAGIKFSLAAAEQQSKADSAIATHLEDSAKSLAFNVAANCWPGWDDEGVELRPEHIQAGLALAEQSMDLVRRLHLGNHQEATAHWLVGALHLALGHNGLAAIEFDRAKDAFDAGSEQTENLMVRGYRAIVEKREPGKRNDAAQEFARIIAVLENDNSDKAKFFSRQLRTADRVLNQ